MARSAQVDLPPSTRRVTAAGHLAKKHVTMGGRPSVRMIGEGLATLELRASDHGACARAQIGARQVLREGTRRLVPIGTSSSSLNLPVDLAACGVSLCLAAPDGKAALAFCALFAVAAGCAPRCRVDPFCVSGERRVHMRGKAVEYPGYQCIVIT